MFDSLSSFSLPVSFPSEASPLCPIMVLKSLSRSFYVHLFSTRSSTTGNFLTKTLRGLQRAELITKLQVNIWALLIVFFLGTKPQHTRNLWQISGLWAGTACLVSLVATFVTYHVSRCRRTWPAISRLMSWLVIQETSVKPFRNSLPTSVRTFGVSFGTLLFNLRFFYISVTLCFEKPFHARNAPNFRHSLFQSYCQVWMTILTKLVFHDLVF